MGLAGRYRGLKDLGANDRPRKDLGSPIVVAHKIEELLKRRPLRNTDYLPECEVGPKKTAISTFPDRRDRVLFLRGQATAYLEWLEAGNSASPIRFLLDHFQQASGASAAAVAIAALPVMRKPHGPPVTEMVRRKEPPPPHKRDESWFQEEIERLKLGYKRIRALGYKAEELAGTPNSGIARCPYRERMATIAGEMML